MDFSIKELLEIAAGYKCLPFPRPKSLDIGKDGYVGHDFEMQDTLPKGYDGKGYNYLVPMAEPEVILSDKGTAIYKKDMQGNYYFMPVTFIHKEKEYEIDFALISVTGKKRIIETPLVGRKGSVKELISLDDYQITITGAVVGKDQQWPQEKLNALNELYNINEAVDLKCALTDIFFAENDKVVIQEFNLPKNAQTEHVQIIEIKCVTDKAFELIIN